MKRGNWWIGAVLIVLGVIVLLNNLGVTQMDIGSMLRTYWPLLLIIWGINILVEGGRLRSGKILSAAVLLFIGLVLLARNLGFLEFSMATFWRFFWPAVLILAGISLLKGPFSGGKNNIAFMSGMEKTKGSWKLESGNYWAVMGGVELDLRGAELEEEKYLLSCTAIMGGIEITVPRDLTVICEGTALLGGIDFLGEGSGGIVGSSSLRREAEGESRAEIMIYCRAILGGIEIMQKD